ncbi:MAG TPA: NUDIX domain-containing protein, partial [Candidatus Saccharimonadales bacterium]|nr:NUDIX domain-containing protein [Candidatus Saccharimonadales bacterium]
MSDELVDIIDEKGSKTGKTAMKSIAHKRALWHEAAFVWIYNSKNEVLVQFRSADKQIHANCWDVSVGGHMGAGEDPADNVIRETKEELGVDLNKADLKYLGKLPDVKPLRDGTPHKEWDLCFITKKDTDIKNIKPLKKELSKVKWLPIKELENDINDPERF